MSKKVFKKTSFLIIVIFLFTAVTPFNIGTACASTNDPVVHLLFDNNVSDSSGSNNNGTANGSPGYVAGRVNSAVNFTGVAGQYISLGTPQDLNMSTSDFSVSLWIKNTATSGDSVVISNKNWVNGSNTGWIIALDNNVWQWNFKGATGARKDMDAGGNITDNQWHHLVVSHDRDGYANFFQDGIKFNSVFIGDSTGTIDSGLPTVIGQDGTLSYSKLINSSIDDVMIFRHTLTQEDVNSIYTSATGNAPISRTIPLNSTPNPGPYNVYFGDLHSHTGNSDGVGTPAQAFAQAKNSGRGDFLVVTDHSSLLTYNEFNDCIATANSYTDSNFVAIAAFEQTRPWGHINTFNTSGYVSDGTKLDFYNWLLDNSTSLAQFNHPAENTEFEDFTDYSSEYNTHIKLIEIDNNFNNILWTHETSYIKALDKGWKVAPTAVSDTHTSNWFTGYDLRTAVLAPSLTKANIYDAINNLRVYATEDLNLKLNYSINNAIMGSTLDAPSTFNFAIHVEDPNTSVNGDKITKIEIFTDNGIVAQSNTCNAFLVDWNPTLTSSTSKYYYVKITTADGHRAWTSPIWTGNTGAPSSDTNLSQGKTVTYDSQESGNEAFKAVDGNESTRWCANNRNTGHWISIDLGSDKTVRRVRTIWEKTGKNYKYKLEYSTNGTSWIMYKDNQNTSSTEQTRDDYATATARYIRLTVTGLPIGAWASTYEIQVFGQ